MTTSASAALHVPASSGEVWWIDSRVDVMLTGGQSGGQLGMWLWNARHGAASPLHLHRREDEQFVVLAGTARNAATSSIVFLPGVATFSGLDTVPPPGCALAAEFK